MALSRQGGRRATADPRRASTLPTALEPRLLLPHCGEQVSAAHELHLRAGAGSARARASSSRQPPRSMCVKSPLQAWTEGRGLGAKAHLGPQNKLDKGGRSSLCSRCTQTPGDTRVGATPGLGAVQRPSQGLSSGRALSSARGGVGGSAVNPFGASEACRNCSSGRLSSAAATPSPPHACPWLGL